MVKLISQEGTEFLVERDVAIGSGTIRTMLESSFAESSGEIRFNEISSPVLEKVVEYLQHKYRLSTGNKKGPAFEVPQEIVLELLIASNYLEC